MTGFPIVFLKDIAHIEREIVQAANIEAGERYVGLENINSRGIICGVVEAAAGQIASAKFRFAADHILYGKLRPYLSKIALPDFSGVCSTDILPLKPTELVDKRYLWHCLRQPSLVELANSRATGANLPRLSPKQLEDFEVPFPKLAEQKRIAAILDKADALRAKRRKVLEQLDALAQAIFIEMFGAPSEPARWPVIRVDESGSVQLGRQRAPKYQTGNYTTPYLRGANVFEDRIDFSDLLSMDFDSRDRATYSLEYGDVLLNEGQSTELVGRPAMWRNELPGTCFQNTLVRYRANPSKTNPEYALALFLSYYRAGELSRISSKTSNMAHLGASRFSAMPFPLPPLELQKEFSLRLCSVRGLKQRAASQLQKMDALFSSLQHRAFRGEL